MERTNFRFAAPSIYSDKGDAVFAPEIDQKINGFEQFSKTIVDSGKRSGGSPRFTYVDNSWHWYTFNDYGYSSSRNNSGDKVLGVLLAVASIVTCYFIGKDAGSYKAANRGLGDVRSNERELMQYEESGTRDYSMRLLNRICQAQRAIFSTLKSSAETGIIMKVCLASTLAIGAAGLFFSSGAATALGLVGAFFASVAMAIRFGFNDVDAEIRAIAGRIKDDVALLRRVEPQPLQEAV